jgi:hypothetical protein
MKLAAVVFAVALASPVAVQAGPANPITLTTSMRANRAGKTFPVVDGDALKTADEVEMFVGVSEPAYVYVVQFFADGTSAVLYPQPCPPAGQPRPPNGCGDVLAKPGTELRIPEAGDAFALDDNPGSEHVYFVASREPITKADKAIAGVIDNVRKSAAEPPKPAPAPKTTPPRRRPRRRRRHPRHRRRRPRSPRTPPRSASSPSPAPRRSPPARCSR